MSRQVWGDKVALGITAHALSGIGIGLLICKEKRLRSTAFSLLGISAMAHIYALMTMPSKEG